MNSPLIQIGIMGWSGYRISGTGSVLRTLLQRLHNTSRVKFLAALPPPPDFSKITINPEIETVEVADTETPQEIRPWMEAAFHELRRCQMIFYPDSIILPRQKNGPASITLLHDVLPLTLPEYYLNPVKYWREKKKFLTIAHHADLIITISEYSREMIMKKLGIPKNRIRLIYNGIDPLFHQPRLPSSSVRRGILYVGDLRRRKNVMSLVKAYLRLNQHIRQTHPLIIAADGDLRRVILNLKPFRTGEVHPPIFRPRLSPQELKDTYLSAKIFVFPSLQEGFGLPVIEAQNHGLPVICGKHTALKEITEKVTLGEINSGENNREIRSKDNSSAYHVDMRQPEAIACAITDLLSNPSVYQKYQELGFSNSCRFTSEKMAMGYQSLFEEFADKIFSTKG